MLIGLEVKFELVAWDILSTSSVKRPQDDISNNFTEFSCFLLRLV
jgi:hypothetical protein